MPPLRGKSTYPPCSDFPSHLCHIKNDHRMDRNYLAGTQGDAINAVLAAAGYNFRLLLNWLRLLLCLIASLILPRLSSAHRPQIA